MYLIHVPHIHPSHSIQHTHIYLAYTKYLNWMRDSSAWLPSACLFSFSSLFSRSNFDYTIIPSRFPPQLIVFSHKWKLDTDENKRVLFREYKICDIHCGCFIVTVFLIREILIPSIEDTWNLDAIEQGLVVLNYF